MERSHTWQVLSAYQSAFEEEQFYRKLTLDFMEKHPEFWQRTTLAGHLTGSAWVINSARDKALLIHHRTLDKWFQPGGHVEPEDVTMLDAARREVLEETGLQHFTAISEDLFDLDVHLIPAKGDIPEHHHYDLRFAFQAESEVISVNPGEVKDLAWVPLEMLLRQLDTQQSVRRMAIKTLLASSF